MKAALIALALLATPAAADTNLLINGDFSGGTYDFTGVEFYSRRVITKAVPNGWSASPGYLEIWNSTFPDGVFLGNNLSDPVGSITQTFADVSGQTYLATFNLSITDHSGIFEVLLNATEIDNLFDSPPSAVFRLVVQSDYDSIPFPYDSPFSFRFIGTGLDTLTFAGGSGDGSFLLEDISVAAVPEPSTWALLLFGFAFFGLRQIWPGEQHR